ncbi:hypothetical protein BC332_31589 [Capsicum chinense]|nr:hypothetical protein BC332_31589 [Capsicum chinense]
MQKTGELAAPLVVPEANYVVDPVETIQSDWIEHTSRKGKKYVIPLFELSTNGSLVSAHGDKSSPIVVSPAANLPTIVASESSSLSGKVSSPMIETVEMKNSSEPASPAVANSEKIGIANVKKDATITEIGGATPSDEKTVELGPLVYESKAEAKSAFKTLLESANIGSDCTWDQAMRAVINDRRYGALKSLGERKQAFNEYLNQKKKLEAEERRVKQKKAREDFRIMLEASSQWRKVQDRLETDERCSRLEKINCLEIFQEYIRDLDSEEEEQRKLWMEELRKAERKNRDEFRKLMEEHVAAGILNAKTNWRDYCIKIKDFSAYLAVSSNTSGSIANDLFTDVMDELEKQYLDDKSQIKDAVRMAEFVFEELLERAREKEEKETKKRKRLADEFYEFLHASKEITASSKWEDCKSLFGDRQVASFAFIDLELVTRLQGPLESDN